MEGLDAQRQGDGHAQNRRLGDGDGHENLAAQDDEDAQQGKKNR